MSDEQKQQSKQRAKKYEKKRDKQPVTHSIENYINRELLRFSTAGSVDDGKSTLIGRMLFDSKGIFKDQMEALKKTSELRGEKDINLALLTDGLRAEREQGITIDVAYRYFSTPKRKFIIADTPGHEQYTRNMVIGASTADLAVFLVDARNGVVTQSKRHAFLASLLGIPHILVAINKMDAVDYSQEVYNKIVADYLGFSEKLDIHDIEFIPISALKGDNVVHKSRNMKWYKGPTVMYYLENVTISADRNLIDFRFPVQYVVRPHQDFRGFAGRVASGTVQVGEEIVALPSGQKSAVKEIYEYDNKVDEAFASQSVVMTLKDEIDISRGDMIVRAHNIPTVKNDFEAIICWMDEKKDLNRTTHYLLQHSTKVVKAYVSDLFYKINVNTLHREDGSALTLNEIGRVMIKTGQNIFYDAYSSNRQTGSFILIDPATYQTVAAGMIRTDSRTGVEMKELGTEAGREQRATNIVWERGEINREDREQRNKHQAAVLWFTGLSGSGKSTIAKALEKKLFDRGVQVMRLDGDNVRHGLCGDLGFSDEERQENIRRIAHVAGLFFEGGNIVLCSFISPNREMRHYARDLVPEGRFIEIFVDCPLEECKKRDPKGLYKKAIAGEIKEFTGITAPYETPENPEVVLDTSSQSLAECVAQCMRYLEPYVVYSQS
mgnify:CR=1 FL=1